jgi:hypothetical protein
MWTSVSPCHGVDPVRGEGVHQAAEHERRGRGAVDQGPPDDARHIIGWAWQILLATT